MPERILSLSGGKDSMYIAYHMQDTYDRIVYFDIGIEYPFVADLIEWVRCNIYKPLEIIRPQKSYSELFEKFSAPTNLCKWCNSKLKMNCVKQYKDKYHDSIDIIGIAFNEPQRIKYDNNLSYPLFDNRISEQMILANLAHEPYYSLYQGWYDNFTRLGCMKCPNLSRKELIYLFNYYPDEFYQLWYERNHWEQKYNNNYYGNHDADYIFNLAIYESKHGYLNMHKRFNRDYFDSIQNGQLELWG